MKDLDFDELDRAVNSLMNDKTSPAPGDTSSSVSPASASVTSSVTPSQPEPAVSMPTPRQAPPAARRGGRFMDVVPATRKAKDVVSTPVSREGVNIQPSAPLASLTTQSDKAVVEAPTAKENATPTTDWPDPLELAASKETPAPDASEVPGQLNTSTRDTVEQEDVSMPDMPDQAASLATVDEPLSSPFLPDAKVEKRPLGGAALASTGSELTVEDENAQLPALPKDVEPALPEELHGDIASIEADNSTTDPAKHVESNETTKESLPKGIEPKKPTVTVTEAIVPSGPTSIPQQYKEEPSSGDKENGAIYDTDSYHQPLSHPAKEKHGWSWVLWILLILLVGAGGGAALYFLGIF